MIAEEFEITGPKNTFIDAYAYWDEVVNGTDTGKKGALQAEMYTDAGTKSGTYAVTIRSRLGGTSQLSETRTVNFKIVD